jgi:hypothetical protein
MPGEKSALETIDLIQTAMQARVLVYRASDAQAERIKARDSTPTYRIFPKGDAALYAAQLTFGGVVGDRIEQERSLPWWRQHLMNSGKSRKVTAEEPFLAVSWEVGQRSRANNDNTSLTITFWDQLITDCLHGDAEGNFPDEVWELELSNKWTKGKVAIQELDAGGNVVAQRLMGQAVGLMGLVTSPELA